MPPPTNRPMKPGAADVGQAGVVRGLYRPAALAGGDDRRFLPPPRRLQPDPQLRHRRDQSSPDRLVLHASPGRKRRRSPVRRGGAVLAPHHVRARPERLDNPLIGRSRRAAAPWWIRARLRSASSSTAPNPRDAANLV